MLYTCHLKILIAEDHRESAAAMADLLRERDHEVIVTPTAVGAWGAVETAHGDGDDIDWLIADVFLPDDTAWDLMRDLRRRFEIRGIAVSESTDPSDIARSFACGFEWHLGKPVIPQLLVQSLDGGPVG